jgi:HD superfamily phosphohydrolase
MIDAEPWGLAKSAQLLKPEKVITDPVHGDIYLNRLELEIVNSRPLQRLRRVRQLGMTPLVYPGATNTRLSHSLGALRVAQDLLDIILEQRNQPHGIDRDLFDEWRRTISTEKQLERQLGEVIVAARLGALLHDLAHVPFGHSIEDDLGILPAHDAGTDRFNELWQQIQEDLEASLTSDEFASVASLVSGPLANELRPLILSKERDANGKLIRAQDVMTYPFVADLVGDTICADLIDYVSRDHLYSGLPMSLGHRFLDAFFVTPSTRTRLGERMALNVVREGRERTDIITELLKYLRYRYELTERVLVHHAKLSADAMIGKALELWHAELETAAEARVAADADLDHEQIAAVEAAAKPLEELPTDSARERARKDVERRLLAHGDDGLLEYLLEWSAADSSPIENAGAVHELVDGLLRRDLFRLTGRSSSQQASAEAIYRQHGSPESRRELEQDAAAFAGIDQSWKICIWLPPPNPRLKSAEVLTFDGSEVVEFYRSEQYKAKRGEDIYDSHTRLWAVSVYVHRSVAHPQARLAALRLAQRMEVKWDREVERLGSNVLQWPEREAAIRACDAKGLGRREDDLLREAEVARVARGPQAPATFDALEKQMTELADGLGGGA